MVREEMARILASYGAPAEVLEEYNCVPEDLRIVRDVLKVRTPSGVRALKKVFMPAERLAFVHACTEYVHQRNFPCVPRFIRNRYGDPFVIHETGLYYMTPWLRGRAADLGKPAELAEAARTLGEWHRAADGFGVAYEWRPQEQHLAARLQKAREEMRTIQSQFSRIAFPTPFQALFLRQSGELMERIDHALADMTAAGLSHAEADACARGSVCHGQAIERNFLFNGGRMAVLTYDHVYCGLPLQDLAQFMERYLPAHKWEGEAVQAVLLAYGQGAGELDEAALALLSALLAAPLRPLQVALWYHRQARPWDEEAYVAALESAIKIETLKDVARMGLRMSTVRLIPAVDTALFDGSVPVSAEAAHAAREVQPAPTLSSTSAFASAFGVSADLPEVEAGKRQEPSQPQAERQLGESSAPGEPAGLRTNLATALASLRRRKTRNRKGVRTAGPIQPATPAVPGLRLWDPLRRTDEHRREHDEQQQQNDQIEGRRPEDGSQK